MSLRQYQQMAVDSTIDHLLSGEGNPAVAMPTGTGKSHVIAGVVQKTMEYAPTTRTLMLTHVKELIKQNAEKLVEAWPNAPVGIFSAGLGKKQANYPIVYAGVQSVYKSLDLFTDFHLIHIDEMHLVSPNGDTAYRQIIDHLREKNPLVKATGYSATPYRTRTGSIIGNGVFDKMVVDQTSTDWFSYFIEHGYLVPLRPKRTRTQLDVSRVAVQGGDYSLSQLNKAVDVDSITYDALRELCEHGHDRTSWLVFASGVDHAEHIAQALQYFGVGAVAVHSKLEGDKRDEYIAHFKRGLYRALVVNNIGTIGFDHPPIDLIGMLRPTLSTALWVQMLGRGLRPSPATMKSDCLVLDFAGNTARLGPINDPVIPGRSKPGTGDMPVWICPACDFYNHAAARFCVECGEEHKFENKLNRGASELELMKFELAEMEWFDVQHVVYALHEKEGSPDTIKVSYQCGLRQFNEWVCLEHVGFPAKKARDWWRQRHWSEPPGRCTDALHIIRELRKPSRVYVHVNKKYPEIIRAEF